MIKNGFHANGTNGTNGATRGAAGARLVDQFGRPFDYKHPDGSAKPGGIAVPHVFTLIARYEGADHTYLHGRFDEALRRSKQDAEVMRRDAAIMGLLRERRLAVSNLNWHLEVPDDKDKYQARVRDGMTRIVRGIPFLRRVVFSLTDAIWRGREGVQLDWINGTFMDRPGRREKPASQPMPSAPMMPGMPPAPVPNEDDDRPRGKLRPCLVPKQFWPVNGDKIGYQHDHTPYLLIASDRESEIKELDPYADVISTTAGGRGLSLRGSWRERFVIHKHEMEDVDFENAEQGDAIHGVGIRSQIFWINWLRLEWLSNVSSFFDQIGLGMTLWKYPAGNDQARKDALAAAQSHSSRTHLLVPIWASEGREALTGVERIEVPTAGCESLVKLIEYLDRIIERFVVGQAGSSRPGPAGIGNSATTQFQMETKGEITKHDAYMLSETLTGSEMNPGLLSTIQRWTFPKADFPVRWTFDIEKTGTQGDLQQVRAMLDMGLELRADEVRSAGGFSKPAEGDEVIKAPQPPGMPGAPGAPPMGAPPGMPGAPPGAAGPLDAGGAPPTPDATGAGAPPAQGAEGGAEGEGGGDFLQALQMMRQGTASQYAWQNKGMVKVSPSGLPLYRWWDPARRQARIQNVPPGGGASAAPRSRGVGPGRTQTASLDVGPKTAILVARLLKLMFPGGWVKPSGLPALVGAEHGTAVAPFPRRDHDGTCVIELRTEDNRIWELCLCPTGDLFMDPPEEPNEVALKAMAVAGIDHSGHDHLPQGGVPPQIQKANAKRHKIRHRTARSLMEQADAILPRAEEEEQLHGGASAPLPAPPGRLGVAIAHLRQTGRGEFAEQMLLAYQRRQSEEGQG